MRKLSQWLVLALFTTAAGSALAAGATVETFKVKDQSLIASFDNDQVITCADGVTQREVNSAIDMHYASMVVRGDGVTTLQSVVLVDVHYVNLCTGDDLFLSGFALSANGSVSTDLARGHVDGAVTVMTEPDPDTGLYYTGTVNLNLNFTANGSTSTVRNRNHSRGGGVIEMDNFTYSSRPGVATGTAASTFQGPAGTYNVDLIGGIPSLNAQLGKDASGTMTIVTKAH